MAYRERFPLMNSLLDFPPSEIFSKIMGENDMPESQQMVYVAYHLSTSNKKKFNDKVISITVVHNPSHLEAANAASQGKLKLNKMIMVKQNRFQIFNQMEMLHLLDKELYMKACFYQVQIIIQMEEPFIQYKIIKLVILLIQRILDFQVIVLIQCQNTKIQLFMLMVKMLNHYIKFLNLQLIEIQDRFYVRCCYLQKIWSQ